MTPKQILTLIRPHTLPASAAPVLLGILYAAGHAPRLHAHWVALSVLCVLIGLSAQALSNVFNDYLDYKQGSDTDKRVGFTRLLTRGEVSQQSVLRLAAALAGVFVLCGVAAVILSRRWWLLSAGILILWATWAYTSGKKYSIAALGLGEAAVVLFYGWVAVMVTAYLTGAPVGLKLFCLSTAVGLVVADIMVVNNYRDYEEDKLSGKRTLVVRLGRPFGLHLYTADFLAAVLLLFPYLNRYSLPALIPYLWLMLRNRRTMQTHTGRVLNGVLTQTGIGVLLFAAAAAVGLITQPAHPAC